jgi:lysyl-tRNA synthetase class 2
VLMKRIDLLRNSVHRTTLYAAAPVVESHSVKQFNSLFGAKVVPGDRLSSHPVVMRGRIAAKREASKKLIFYTIEAQASQVQVMCNLKDAGDKFEEMHSLTSRGDWVSVHGVPGSTQVWKNSERAIFFFFFFFPQKQSGQLSVVASSVMIESPCLLNLPLPGSMTAQHEHRRRHRDMLVNSDSVRRLETRSRILSWLRKYLDGMGFLEVETPILSQRCGGAMATPFVTASDPPLFLRIAPELYLKKLVVGGLDAVYEIGKQFRNEGVDKTHVNEFTTIELYRANWDYEILMGFTEQVLRDMSAQFGAGSSGVDFSLPFQRLAIIPAINASAGSNLPEDGLDEGSLPQLMELCLRHDVVVSAPTVGRCVDKLVQRFVEPQCKQPTFLTDHPRVMSPLAKGHRTKGPQVAERFELFIGGVEYVNA